MNVLATFCYFVATFGAAWMLCMRASDWNTDRWADDTRWTRLILGAFAWVSIFILLGEKLFVGNAKRSDAVSIAIVAGLLCGIATYALLAWLWPGTGGAQRMAPSLPPVIPDKTPKSPSEWLLLDLRAVPTVLRRRKSRSEK